MATDPTQRQLRILVVEDNEDSRDLLGAMLMHEGHHVVCVADGPEALRAALEMGPDVLLLDLGLPSMDGFQVAAEIRRQPGTQPRLIAITGYGADSDRSRASAAGFDDFFVKPVRFAGLREALARR